MSKSNYTLPKIKLSYTVEVEYEINPEDYPGCRTWEDMLEVDIENVYNYPMLLLELEGSKMEVKGEVIK